MGLRNWLNALATRIFGATIEGDGEFAVEVVGESRYQKAIETVAGRRTPEGCQKVVDAVLVLEDSNPHDSKAVQVKIGGRVCGYLSRDDARRYRKRLKALGQPRATTTCKAMIVGGWDKGPEDRGHFGVRLDIQTSD